MQHIRRTSADTRAELIDELKLVRRRGPDRLSDGEAPHLEALAEESGEGGRVGVRRVLLQTAAGLDGTTGQVARILFGLDQGLRGRRPQELRGRAADAVVADSDRPLHVDTFRRNYEPHVLECLADELLRLEPLAPAQAGEPAATDAGSAGALQALARDLERVRGYLEVSPDGRIVDDFGPYEVPTDGPTSATARVFVHAGPVEELRNVQLLVSSENTYLEPARMFFSTTLSGHLRRAAARFDADGRIVQDVVADELGRWVHEHGRPGVPVPAGTVVPTSAGSLERVGVVRILHAAVIAPRTGVKGYDVPPDAVLRAVRRCFELAAQERAAAGAQVGSWGIQLPLFGAGDGGLSAASSFSILWHAVCAALRADPTWRVHLSTWETKETATVLEGLLHSVGRS